MSSRRELVTVAGIIGIVLALTRSGYGIGFPIAGSSISALALIIAAVMGLAMFAATSGVLSDIADEMEATSGDGTTEVVPPPDE